jgi:uncharacterized RDD family membrane protein YckC
VQPIPLKTFETANAVGFMPADNNKRVIAFIIDSIISAGLTKLSALFLFSGIVQIHPWASMSLQFVLVTGLYWVMMPRFFRGTVGKKIMGLRIVATDNSLEVGVGQLILRETVGRILSIVPLGLGYWWVSFNPERKTFHDIISKTKVIHYR